jgi:hypothetical protein
MKSSDQNFTSIEGNEESPWNSEKKTMTTTKSQSRHDDEEGAEDKDIGVGKEKRMMLFSLTESSQGLWRKVFESHSIKSQETYRCLSFSLSSADASQDDKLRPGESGTNYVIDSPRYLTSLW